MSHAASSTAAAAGSQPSRVLVIGAGGHARVCIEALLDTPDCEVVGCVSKTGESVASLGIDLGPGTAGVQVVGTDEQLDQLVAELAVTHLFVAITNNRVRAEFVRRCELSGLALANAVSRGAYVSRWATVGNGTLLAAGAVVNTSARVGNSVIVNTNASVGHDSIIGDGSHIGPGVAMGGTVLIGTQVLIGLGARVVPGISIGDGATVGAGSVVVRDVPARTVVVGSPARRIERSRS